MGEDYKTHTKELHSLRLSSRHHLLHPYNHCHHTTSLTMPSSISKRSKTDCFKSSNVNAPFASLNESLPQNSVYPRYRNGSGYFDRPFSQQNVMSRERLIRRTLSLIILSLLLTFVTYVCLLRVSRSHHSSPRNSPSRDHYSKDSHIHPMIPPTQFSHEQIHLYRILGNDLPPRHKPGQVLQNLMFILENEPSFPNTKKWWVLNRIVDSEYEDSIIELLKHYQQEYVRIPFEIDEYMKKDFRLDDFPEPDFFHSSEYMNFSKVAKLRTIDYTYHDKNLYAMNNNGGRNAALMHGKSQPNARWIMPFDGNCFLTANGFNEIISQIEKWGEEYKYFLVPMKRLLNNTELLVGPDQRPSTPEEPQVIFRYDAQEIYNENMRYGRRSKLEMLWRLGVPTPRRMLNKPSVPWEIQDAPYFAPPKDKYKTVGWIFRLFSGKASLEESGVLRAFNRLLAIQDFLDGIDERIARVNQGFDPSRLSLYDEKILSRARLDYWTGRKEVLKIVDVMIDRANEIVSSVCGWYRLNEMLPADPNTLVKFLEVKGDKGFRDNDRLELSGTTKPDAASSPNGSRGYESQSYSVNKDSELYRDEFGQYISTAPTTLPNFSTALLFENVTTLTFAHYFSGDVRYSRWAANLVRTFIFSSYGICEQDEIAVASYKNDPDSANNEGYGFPHLSNIPRTLPKFTKRQDNSSYVPSIFPYDLIETDPSYFLDACRLLYRAKSLTHKEYIDLQQFASLWLEYLINSREGMDRAFQPDHRGTLYDLQVLSLSGFTNDVRLYLRVSNRIRMRIGKQFYLSDEVSQPLSQISQPYEVIYAKDQIDLRKAGSHDIAARIVGGEAINNFLIYENDKFRYSSLNLQYWMLITRLVQNVGIGSDLWNYKTNGLKLSKVMMGHMSRYSSRKSKLEYIINNSNIDSTYDYNLDEAYREEEHVKNRIPGEKGGKNDVKVETVDSNGDVMPQEVSSSSFTEDDAFILKPLICIAQAVHEIDDRRLGIRHEHGDEHDYFQPYIKSFSSKMELIDENLGNTEYKNEKRKILDNNLGIGKESRERGIPPYWMLGVA